MIKYGSDHITELKFTSFAPYMERRDFQWVDIVLRFDLDERTPAPDDLIDLTALIICATDGTIVQMIPQDEDCDCEYQFTFSEKEQIRLFIEREDIQSRIHKLSAPQ